MKIRLTCLGDDLFPVSLPDAQALRDKHVTITRIPKTSLGLLRKTLLKSVNLEIVPWSGVRSGVLNQFMAALKKSKVAFVSEKKDRFVVKSTDSNENELNQHIRSLRDYMMRYGISLSQNKKYESKHTLIRISLMSDPELDTSLGFKSSSMKRPDSKVFILPLSAHARLTLAYDPLSPESPLSITFQDLSSGTDPSNTQWVDSFRRSFKTGKQFANARIEFASGLVALNE